MKLFPVLCVILLCGCATEHHRDTRLIKPSREDLATRQPTLRWELYTEPGVTYDVVVYEVVRMSDSRTPGRQVAYAEGVTTPFYTLPEPLAPGDYCWSVRVRRGDQVEGWRLRSGVTYAVFVTVSYNNRYASFRIPKG
jgi:hypothetical protein